MKTIDKELIRATQWFANNEQQERDIAWNNRSKEVIRFHSLLNENIKRMLTISDATTLDKIANLGGFRIYLVNKENIPYYTDNFEGQYTASSEHFHYRRLNESLIPTLFYAIRCREGLERNELRRDAELAIQNLVDIVSTPFQSGQDIPYMVKNINNVNKTYLRRETSY